MDIAKTYDPATVEDRWYGAWMAAGLFRSTPDEREPYTIVIPPPNVTGVLHMGHMLNNTIQDVLIRRARMLGKNACWVPGTDHASIATEAKVVGKLREEGIRKSDLTRDEFMRHAWEWTEKHGGIILEQLKKLGASCDWDRTRFTMDESLSEAVTDVFIDLYRKGYIYRGTRMVNWDPKALTAVSDEEVFHKEEQSRLFYVKYAIAGSRDFITIATTRPETILGDTAICVHPDDERYTHLQGKKAVVPLINREVPVICDPYVDPAFGTGALKVTPAHDANDYELGQKHNLETIDILNPDGSLSEAAVRFVGMDRFEAREAIAKALKEEGCLEKIETLNNKVGYSERTGVIIEPRLSLQWFCRMKEMAEPALEHVLNGDIRFFPSKFINTYKHWMENVRDWCISRQLWWGQRIPAWYYGSAAEDFVVAKTAGEALQKAKEKSGKSNLKEEDLRQDDDVVDTWFSSWLWPISVFDGFRDPDNADIRYYYPTNDLVTAPEILFFWVARMVMAGYEYRGDKPFRNVYLTGIVRDKQGRKMSKSLGNSPDPLNLIARYGADGVRVGMLLCSPAGNDLLFDEKLCEQGRNFCNKIWNAFRLVKGWKVDGEAVQSQDNEYTVQWMESVIHKAIRELEDHFAKFRLSDALMVVYKLIWNEFCSWYLEAVKPAKDQAIDQATYDATIRHFSVLLKLAHPFMPFISEELWHQLKSGNQEDYIMVASWPEAEPMHEADVFRIQQTDIAREIITHIRNYRQEKGISNRESVDLYGKGPMISNWHWVKKLANVADLKHTSETIPNASVFMVGSDEFMIPPTGEVDVAAETEKLRRELDYEKGFLKSVDRKLGNARFVESAPQAVVEGERKKKEDAEARIRVLEAQLSALEMK